MSSGKVNPPTTSRKRMGALDSVNEPPHPHSCVRACIDRWAPARGGWASLVAEPPGALVVGRTAARSPAAEGRQVAVVWRWASSVAELPSAPVMGIR
jgi:hypothetical protein